MSRYFDGPERYGVNENTRDLAHTLASSAAACVHVYGPDHIAVWDEREHRFAAGMLNTIHQHDGKIIYSGTVVTVSAPMGDAPEGERRGWVEVKIPESDD